MSRIAVFGAGTWGTALALLLCDNGHEVVLWSSSEEKADELRKTRMNRNLPGIRFPDALKITASAEEALAGAEAAVLAVASAYTRKTAASLRPYLKKGTVVICVSKGIEKGTLLTQTEQTEEELPDAVTACLSGPSHAEEVIQRLPTTCVAGAHTEETAEYVQRLFMNPFFRVYSSTDLTGIELGGSVKNVIALAAGIADGIGCGDNTKAALITRGIAEIRRLGTAMGADPETFSGLTGIGDLIVTCASMHSRNRRAGILIGKGMSCEAAVKEVGQVVEGVVSAGAALSLAERYGVSMPIVSEVNRILFEGKDPKAAVMDLMMRNPTSEIW